MLHRCVPPSHAARNAETPPSKRSYFSPPRGFHTATGHSSGAPQVSQYRTSPLSVLANGSAPSGSGNSANGTAFLFIFATVRSASSAPFACDAIVHASKNGDHRWRNETNEP